MILKKNKYQNIFILFIVSIVVVFIYTRPFNSPYQKFIDGDGLGYYAYLPAKFIYNDSNYEFKWFNEVHKSNYQFCSFEKPVDNFLTPYQGKFINKYYQGLSLLWLPFFLLAHTLVNLTNYAPDGYSLPYQWCIGFASMFYLLIGLTYLRKLILKLYQNEWIAIGVTMATFYGTHLFHYSVQLNSQSHVYSFTFITLFLYALYNLFNEEQVHLKWILVTSLFFIIIICIRPLNSLILLVTPSLMPTNFTNKNWQLRPFNISIIAILLLIMFAVFHQIHILYTQTGSFMPYTYTNERFYFYNSHLLDAMLSYHMGLFTYVPLACMSFVGAVYLPTKKQKIIFPVLFILMMFLYSSWWYWTITQRTLIDFYPILSIMLGSLLFRFKTNLKHSFVIISLVILSVLYHQLKNYQIHEGILHEFYTHKELFWKNFLRIKPSNTYVIHPSSIIKKEIYTENFENKSYKGSTSNYRKKSGEFSAVLYSDNPFSSEISFQVPTFMNEIGDKKIRISFHCWFNKNVKSTQSYLKLYNYNDSLITVVPFYITENKIIKEEWDYKEFGYEFKTSQLESLAKNNHLIRNLKLFFWNDQAINEVYIDDVKIEFLTTNNEFDHVKN